MMKPWIALGVCVLGACGNKTDGREAAKVDIGADHVAAVNAAIPAELKGTVEFELGTISTGKKAADSFRLAVPKGWKAGFLPGSFEPSDGDGFGSKTLGRTTLKVGSDCNGSCEKKDWAAVSDQVYFSQFTGGKVEGKVVKDDKGANRRTLVFERKVSEGFPAHDVAVNVITAWWDPDGSRYFTCAAEIGAPVKGLAAAFELACAKVSGE